MKKLLLSLIMLLISSPVLFAMGEPAIPPSPRNPECLDLNKLKVSQIMDDGIIGYLCPNDYPSYYDDSFDACRSEGQQIFLPVLKKNNDYVDDQKVTLPSSQCFTKNGTAKFKNGLGMEITLRKIKIISSAVPTK